MPSPAQDMWAFPQIPGVLQDVASRVQAAPNDPHPFRLSAAWSQAQLLRPEYQCAPFRLRSFPRSEISLSARRRKKVQTWINSSVAFVDVQLRDFSPSVMFQPFGKGGQAVHRVRLSCWTRVRPRGFFFPFFFLRLSRRWYLARSFARGHSCVHLGTARLNRVTGGRGAS